MFCKQSADLVLCCYYRATSPTASRHYIGCPEPLVKYFQWWWMFTGYLFPQPGVYAPDRKTSGWIYSFPVHISMYKCVKKIIWRWSFDFKSWVFFLSCFTIEINFSPQNSVWKLKKSQRIIPLLFFLVTFGSRSTNSIRRIWILEWEIYELWDGIVVLKT